MKTIFDSIVIDHVDREEVEELLAEAGIMIIEIQEGV